MYFVEGWVEITVVLVGKKTGEPLIAFNDLTAFLFTTGCSVVHTQQQNE